MKKPDTRCRFSHKMKNRIYIYQSVMYSFRSYGENLIAHILIISRTNRAYLENIRKSHRPVGLKTGGRFPSKRDYGAMVKSWSLASLPTAVLLLKSSTFALHVVPGEFGTVQLYVPGLPVTVAIAVQLLPPLVE